MIHGTTHAHKWDLRQILLDRRHEMEGDVRTRIRDGRTDRHEVLDDGDHSDAALQHGIDFALLQMKAETLARIDLSLFAPM